MVALVFGLQPKEAAERRALFQSFDADGSGSLSLPEFTTVRPRRGGLLSMGTMGGCSILLQHLLCCFLADYFWSLFGGLLGVSSIFSSCTLHFSSGFTLQAMTHVMPGLGSDDAQRIFDVIDIDGDKQISYTEFLAATLDPRDIDVAELSKVDVV
jgi:hypothetical protein